jgi:hypothetical protein
VGYRQYFTWFIIGNTLPGSPHPWALQSSVSQHSVQVGTCKLPSLFPWTYRVALRCWQTYQHIHTNILSCFQCLSVADPRISNKWSASLSQYFQLFQVFVDFYSHLRWLVKNRWMRLFFKNSFPRNIIRAIILQICRENRRRAFELPSKFSTIYLRMNLTVSCQTLCVAFISLLFKYYALQIL